MPTPIKALGLAPNTSTDKANDEQACSRLLVVFYLEPHPHLWNLNLNTCENHWT